MNNSTIHQACGTMQTLIQRFDSLWLRDPDNNHGPSCAPSMHAFVHSADGVLQVLREIPDLPLAYSPSPTDLGSGVYLLLQAVEAVVVKVLESEQSLDRLWTYQRPRHRAQLLAAMVFQRASSILILLGRDKAHTKAVARVAKAIRSKDKRIGKHRIDATVLLVSDGGCGNAIRDKKAQAWWTSKFGSGTSCVDWQTFVAEMRKVWGLPLDREPNVRYFLDFCATGVVSIYSYAAFSFAFGQPADCGREMMKVCDLSAFHGFLTPPEAARLLAQRAIGTFAILVAQLELASTTGRYSADIMRGEDGLHVLSCVYLSSSGKTEFAPVLRLNVDTFIAQYRQLCKHPLNNMLPSMPWFYGDINAKEAADRLATAAPGSWLCRFSSQSLTSLAISYMGEHGSVQSALLDQPRPEIILYQGQQFSSVRALITNLSQSILKVPVVLTSFASRARQWSYMDAAEAQLLERGTHSLPSQLQSVVNPETERQAILVGGGGLYGDLPTDESLQSALQQANQYRLAHTTDSWASRSNDSIGSAPSASPARSTAYGDMPDPTQLDGARVDTALALQRSNTSAPEPLGAVDQGYGTMPTPMMIAQARSSIPPNQLYGTMRAPSQTYGTIGVPFAANTVETHYGTAPTVRRLGGGGPSAPKFATSTVPQMGSGPARPTVAGGYAHMPDPHKIQAARDGAVTSSTEQFYGAVPSRTPVPETASYSPAPNRAPPPVRPVWGGDAEYGRSNLVSFTMADTPHATYGKTPGAQDPESARGRPVSEYGRPATLDESGPSPSVMYGRTPSVPDGMMRGPAAPFQRVHSQTSAPATMAGASQHMYAVAPVFRAGPPMRGVLAPSEALYGPASHVQGRVPERGDSQYGPARR